MERSLWPLPSHPGRIKLGMLKRMAYGFVKRPRAAP